MESTPLAHAGSREPAGERDEALNACMEPAGTPAPRSLRSPSTALYTDEYALTMAQSFLRHGQTGRACFELFIRHLPEHRGYLVAAGLEQALAYLLEMRFTDEDLGHLARSGLYDGAFLDHLAAVRFSGDVDAIPEGTVVGAEVPLVRVVAPRVEATLVESSLLALVNHQTMIASKTSRIVDAAEGRPVWDFSLRRLHGPQAAVPVARAAYIAGAAGTATVIAGQLLDIPTTGTMAHHYVLAFGPTREPAAFEQFLRDFPSRAVLLVDTYDTPRGVDHAIAASQQTSVPLRAIRLDSGDIAALSRDARRRLDAAGMRETQILASGDLDEYRIAELIAAGAPVDAFGVGTMLGTSADAPALGGVYKLVAQEEDGEMRPTMKLSTAKETNPGIHQVFRAEGGDVLGLDGEAVAGRPLLVPMVRRGRLCREVETLDQLRARCTEERDAIPPRVRRIASPEPWPVRRSPALLALRSSGSATTVYGAREQ
jgi:nicotinate phosphoribosyltransferase